MKIAISIEHPAWAHQFRWTIEELRRQGHDVLVLAINKDKGAVLLREFGFPYVLIAETTGTNILQKAWLLILTTWRIFLHCRKFRPDVFIGRASPMLAINSFLFRRPHVLFEDTERSRFSLSICRLCSTIILTPRRFQTNLGHKQRRLDTFKELFSLHPDLFVPDPNVPKRLGLTPKGFIFVRFVAWNASHDFGMSGLSDAAKIELVEKLRAIMPVVISCEDELPEALCPYAPAFPLGDAHHLLANAALYVGEGASMASEAAVLGTFAIYINPQRAGSLETQERLGLLSIMDGPDRYERALDLTRELLADLPGLQARCASAREKLLRENVNAAPILMELAFEAASAASENRRHA